MRRADMKLLLPFLSVLTVTLGVAVAEPWIEKLDLFTGGEGGHAMYRIPAVVTTSQGSVLVFCEARNSESDWADTQILMRRSTDGGTTFDAPRSVAEIDRGMPRNPILAERKGSKPGELTLNNPVPIADAKRNVVHLLFCADYHRAYHQRSQDDGLTWSSPVEITSCFENYRPEYDWKVIATGPGHGLALRNGRLLVPVWLSRSLDAHGHRPSVVSTIISDDGGATWVRGEIVAGEEKPLKDPNETTAVELMDGSVMLNIRSQSPEQRRGVSVSPDGVTRWTRPRFDEALFEPICMGSLLRVSWDESRILFSNPDSWDRSGPLRNDRRNLTIKLSLDEGKAWVRRRVIEAGRSAYSDLAVLPNGTVACFYERDARPEAKGPYHTLTLARFNLAWIEAGE
jgi:sialidase-1